MISYHPEALFLYWYPEWQFKSTESHFEYNKVVKLLACSLLVWAEPLLYASLANQEFKEFTYNLLMFWWVTELWDAGPGELLGKWAL